MPRIFWILTLGILFTASPSFGVISHYFDGSGNPLPTPPSKAAPESEIHRYSMPKGLELQNDISYKYYPVFGKTFTEIIRSSEENGPFDSREKKRFPSKTEWSLGYSFDYTFKYIIDEHESKIHISLEIFDIVFHDDISITLPTLIDDTPLNPIEKNIWKNYLQKLLNHEHEHAKLIRDQEHANLLKKSFEDIYYIIFDYREGLDIQKTVDMFIREETLKHGSEWAKKISSKNADYDRTTKHGSNN